MIVFLVSGLWHGASWNFIVWGALHGTYQLIGIFTKPLREYIVKIFRININTFGHKLFKVVTTFILVDFAWIFFRANSFTDARYIIRKLSVFKLYSLFDGSLYKLGLDQKDFDLSIKLIIFLIIVNYIQRKMDLREKIALEFLPIRWTIYIGIIISILMFGYFPLNPIEFIYFQF
jgi:D-alanyl-lipoteichoic acid acyltransferase DltB (MBOAT superfamily)